VGGLFLSSSLSVPNGWNIGRAVLQVVGALLLVTASGYLVLCALYANKTLKFRKQTVCVPGLELALAQLLLSVIQWPTAAAILFVLLNGSIEFTTILGALLLSSIATVLTHIPAGIGVLEAIFVGIIGRRVPIDQLLAAILVFRVVYYLVPLFVATLAYLATETLSRRVSVDHVSAPRTRNRAPTQ
jgi:uncharacterized membrane protein YbhN (UPF0104 family)